VWHLHDRLSADYLPRSLLTAMRMIAVWGPRGIVVNSQATLDTLPRLARKKASIAYPGLPASAFEAASPVMPRTIGLIGRISPTKGQHEFLDAAAKLAPEFPDVKFQVVGAALFGEDDYEADVRSLARTLGIGERTEFTGWVSDAPVVLRRLSVLLHASPVPEPFGQVIVEGMAAGVPVVATAAGGVTEILDPAGRYALGGRPFRITETGVLVRPGDPSALAGAIRLVLGDPEASAARAALARDDARHRFGIEETASVVATAWAEAMR
jgi:glycosyltransferase involved in cell wall biosynthesis